MACFRSPRIGFRLFLIVAALVCGCDKKVQEGTAQLPAVMDAMGREGMENMTNGPAELAAVIRSESVMWRRVINAANIRGE